MFITIWLMFFIKWTLRILIKTVYYPLEFFIIFNFHWLFIDACQQHDKKLGKQSLKIKLSVVPSDHLAPAFCGPSWSWAEASAHPLWSDACAGRTPPGLAHWTGRGQQGQDQSSPWHQPRWWVAPPVEVGRRGSEKGQVVQFEPLLRK